MEAEGRGEEQKKEEEPKFQAFTGKGVSLGSAGAEAAAGESAQQADPTSDLYKSLAEQYGDDPEMISAIIASMKEDELSQLQVPDEPGDDADPAQVVNIQLRMPDGQRLQRKFLRTNTLGDIMNFIRKEKQGKLTTIKLITTFPKRVYEEGTMTLDEAKFGR